MADPGLLRGRKDRGMLAEAAVEVPCRDEEQRAHAAQGLRLPRRGVVVEGAGRHAEVDLGGVAREGDDAPAGHAVLLQQEPEPDDARPEAAGGAGHGDAVLAQAEHRGVKPESGEQSCAIADSHRFAGARPCNL
jgi:hypothetical protein